MISIAIDGPSGAGKSTISRKAAEKFGFIYVDTGAIYRTIGLATKIHGVSLDDTAAVVALLPTLEIELKYNDAGEQHMYLDGNDVSRDIRLPEVSMLASKVSAIPAVREFLVDMQRGMAEKYDVIMDGRDIGTVILPNADLKIFLTADVRDRARRRELTEGELQDLISFAVEEDRKKAIKAGMNGHIAKPLDIPHLLQVLADVLK